MGKNEKNEKAFVTKEKYEAQFKRAEDLGKELKALKQGSRQVSFGDRRDDRVRSRSPQQDDWRQRQRR